MFYTVHQFLSTVCIIELFSYIEPHKTCINLQCYKMFQESYTRIILSRTYQSRVYSRDGVSDARPEPSLAANSLGHCTHDETGRQWQRLEEKIRTTYNE
jgi:hypothetical protein